MKPVFKNVVQIFVFILVLTRVDSSRISGKTGLSKIQEIPQYRFHYYVQEKPEDNKSLEDYKNGEKVQDLYNVPASSKGDIRVINYRTNKSNGLQSDINTSSDTSPLKISLNDPVYNIQIDTLKEPIISSETSPIVVEPINTQEQKSFETDSRNEYHLTENTGNVSQVTEQVSTNQTQDRKDDVKDEQVTEQVLILDENITSKQTEFTIPFKKPNSVNGEDFMKYNDNEAMKKDIVKVIQNINGNVEQSNPQLNFKSMLSDKPLKIVNADSIEMERQEGHQPSGHGHSNFKSQPLSNKPLRLFGYNPSNFGSLYDTQIDYNRPLQIQQPPNLVNQGYFAGFDFHGDNVKPQSYDSSGMYISQPSSTSQTGNYKVNKKYNVPTSIPTQPLYYYDPNSMIMLPVYTDMIQNTYPIVNKPQPIQPQVDSSKNGFNLMQILNGGSFYKGSEQAESSQQMTVKDQLTKQEFNKVEKIKPSETYDKSKLQQSVMLYLNPGESPIDFKSFISHPIQLPIGQQPQADCNGQKLRASSGKADKPLQPIPLCTDCVPALGLLGLPSTKSAVIQPKKSTISPQIMPIWNGKNVSKLSYLILPNPITKK